MAESERTQREPSMADIARLAGVAKMTVSRVLNNYPHVTERVRQQVLNAASELGYRKNALVSSVMRRVAHSRKVEYATPLVFFSDEESAEAEARNVATQRLIEGARERAAYHGLQLEVMRYRSGELSHQRIDKILETRNIQGLIINVACSEPVRLELNWARLAAATTGGQLEWPTNLPRVQSDGIRHHLIATEELRSRGYRRLGFIYSEDMSRRLGRLTESGILLDYHATPVEDRVFPKDNPWSISRKDFLAWLRDERVEVVLTPTLDHLDWLREAGMRVPEDVGFVWLSKDSNVPDEIAGIYQDKRLLTINAVDIVTHRLFNAEFGLCDNPTRTLVPSQWIDGRTVLKRVKRK